jgi:tetratricopeptide (TPR) repeat protein
MDKLIRDDFDKVEVTYYKMEPTSILPVPKKENCLKITGISKELLLDALNKSSSYLQFKECSQNPILITFESTDDSAMGKNNSAQKLKDMGSSAKGGNTLLGMLLLSAVDTDSEMVKAKGQVIIKFNKAVAEIPFETEYFDAHYVKSEKRPNGKTDLEQVVISKTLKTIWNNINPYWRGSKIKLVTDVKNDYYEDFRWDLHHEQYYKAISKLQALLFEHPANGDLYFNLAILNEYFREYDKALENYKSAVKFNYSDKSLLSSMDRVQKEISYRTNIAKINPGLLTK